MYTQMMDIREELREGCNRSGRSPLSDLSESGDTFGVSGNVWVTDTLLEKRRGIGRIGDTVWSLV
jgi:hypothetical protein